VRDDEIAEAEVNRLVDGLTTIADPDEAQSFRVVDA
jgi:hypothetical protein